MMVLENMMELYDWVRWVLFFFVLYLAISSSSFWLYGVCFIIAWWPKPEQRQDFFYGPRGILNRDKPKY